MKKTISDTINDLSYKLSTTSKKWELEEAEQRLYQLLNLIESRRTFSKQNRQWKAVSFDSKIESIKEVRRVLSLGLKDSKDFVEGTLLLNFTNLSTTDKILFEGAMKKINLQMAYVNEQDAQLVLHEINTPGVSIEDSLQNMSLAHLEVRKR